MPTQDCKKREHSTVAEDQQPHVHDRRSAALRERSHGGMKGPLRQTCARRRSSRIPGCRSHLKLGNRDFESLVAMLARAMSLFGGRRWGHRRRCTGIFEWAWRFGIEGQSRLQIGDRTAATAGAIILKLAGNLAPPLRLNGQVSIGRGSNSARNRRATESAQRGVAKRANIGRVAVDGAALLTGFYHRSVLRCGRLAERKSGVADILSAERRREKICVDIVANWIPQAARPVETQSIASALSRNFVRRKIAAASGATGPVFCIAFVRAKALTHNPRIVTNRGNSTVAKARRTA